MFEYDVDFVFESSDFIYERTYPALKCMNKYQNDYRKVEMPVRISMPKYSLSNELKLKNIDKNNEKLSPGNLIFL